MIMFLVVSGPKDMIYVMVLHARFNHGICSNMHQNQSVKPEDA